ncbi:unnamed protein product [Lactuca saligna]|uniref:Uncharacterized protein n=1 Tax=Lactuca saligna TaxID=75948 RepID=A0AA35UM28_LACSI|nr:unnamed protein product [Lactuca saligna]
MLGFSSSEVLVDPQSISSSVIQDMFYQMGYLENLSLISKLKKPNLPTMLNEFFTVLFKRFSVHSKISCGCFWSIIVQRAIVNHQIQVQYISVIAAIPIFHTSNFIVSDPTKFDFIGSIPEAMLLKVPTNNVLISEYRKKPASDSRPMPEDLRRALEEGN